MKIVVYSEGGNPDAWLAAIGQHIPGAQAWAWAPGAPQADYALVWRPPQQLLDEQGAGLKAIFNMGAGVDALFQLQLPAGVPVVRLEDAGMAVQMAEYVCHAVIDHFRGLNHYRNQQLVGEWKLQPLRSRQDFPVGIMGLGVLGDRVAKAVAQFDFPVQGWSRSAKQLDGIRTFHGAEQFGDFLAHTRILVNLLPLTPETENIINRATLQQLLPGAYVINVARGAHLVDEDLIALIAEGHVAGAMLDVFRQEPLPAGHPFWTIPQITMTPHTSARTLREESIAQIVGKVAAMSRGEPVQGMVNPQRGY